MWGWIPHINKKFSDKFINNKFDKGRPRSPDAEFCSYFEKTLKNENDDLRTTLDKSILYRKKALRNKDNKNRDKILNDIHSEQSLFYNEKTIIRFCDDHIKSRYCMILFEIPSKEKFHFGLPFNVKMKWGEKYDALSRYRRLSKGNIECDDTIYECKVTIFNDGLIRIYTEYEENSNIRNLLKEVYYFIRDYFSKGIFKEYKKSSKKLEIDHTDDMISLTFSQCRSEAIHKIINSYLRVAESKIDNCMRDNQKRINSSEQVIQIQNIMRYSNNFIEIFKKDLYDVYDSHKNALDRMNKEISGAMSINISFVANELSLKMILLSEISISVAVFAILNDLFPNVFSGKALITVIIVIFVMTLVGAKLRKK